MKFFGYYPPKQELADGTFTDRKALPYLFVMVFLGFLSFNFTGHWTVRSVVGLVLGAAISLWGLNYSYKRNGKSNGSDLVKRFVVVSWIVCIRCFLLLIIVLLPIYAFGDYRNSNEFINSWPMLVVSLAFLALVYQRIGHHLGEIQELCEQVGSGQPDNQPGKPKNQPD